VTLNKPIVAEYLSGGPPGVALDAACGTGRFAEFLARQGQQVIGVDSSPDMLSHARRAPPLPLRSVAGLDEREERRVPRKADGPQPLAVGGH
jgi:SAM-dependent methyltransferase